MFLPEPPPPLRSRPRTTGPGRDGYVNNNTRLWSYRPDVSDRFVELRSLLMDGSSLSERELAVLLVAAVAARADSYCALAWGTRLARLADDDARPPRSSPAGRPSRSRRGRRPWPTGPAPSPRDPNGTTPEDVAALRDSGLTAKEVFEATAYVAFRLAFSTVDNALGAEPDHQLAAAPPGVREAVSFGRPPATSAG